MTSLCLLALKPVGSLEQLLLRYPRAAVAWKALGIALWSQKKNALVPLRRAAQLSPGDAEAHSNLGKVLLSLGRAQDAVASSRSALELKPNFVAAHCNLGNAFLELSQMDEALACYQRAIALH